MAALTIPKRLFAGGASVRSGSYSGSALRQAGRGRGCVKTLEPPMAQCIFGHVDSISRDFVDSSRALPHVHGRSFCVFTQLGL
jgi:hypothetical protein